MMWISVVLVACGGSGGGGGGGGGGGPRAGDTCAVDGQGTCADTSTILECHNGIWRGVGCPGPLGCSPSGTRIYCDFNGVQAGGGCLHIDEGASFCSLNGASLFLCTNGTVVKQRDCPAGCTDGRCLGSDPAETWSIRIDRGTVTQYDPTNAAWDVPGGLPDPMVCLTINGRRACTPTKQDTLTPVWSYTFPAARLSYLRAGVTVEMLDEDLADNDTICGSGVIPIDDSDLTSRTWAAQCTYGSFTATLIPPTP